MRPGTGFFAVGLLFVCLSCNDSTLWGQSRDAVLHDLEVHNYSFLDQVEPSKYDKILTLGDDAPYYIALHLSDAGRIDDSRAMLDVGVRKSPEPFKTLCLRELTRTGTATQRLESVVSFLGQLPAGPGTERAALEELRAKLELETGKIDGEASSIPVWFYSQPMTEELSGIVPSLPEGYPADFYKIASVRAALFRRDYQVAWIGASALLQSGTDGVFYRYVISDFGKAALYGSTDFAVEAAFFDKLRASGHFDRPGQSEAPFMLAFYAGRLYARAAAGTPESAVVKGPSLRAAGKKTVKPVGKTTPGNDYEVKSHERLETAFSLAATDEDRDYVIWYILDTASRQDPDKFLDILEQYAPVWKKPAFYSDILDSCIVRLVAKRDWEGIARLRWICNGKIDRELAARLDYLSARSGLLTDSEMKDAYKNAFENDHTSLYYRVMSAEALDIPVGDPVSLIAGLKKGNAKTIQSDDAATVLNGFLVYSLPERIYPIAEDLYPGLSVHLATDLAKKLDDKGRYSDSIRLVLLAIRSTEEPVTDEELKLIYPRPWLPEVSAAAARFNLPEYLIYALIRSESFFRPDVVSNAGATGLTQLMKLTAGDIASRLDAGAYDLSNPATNITFGAYYLSEMIRRMDRHVLPALFAYNAGLTRVRAWQKDGHDLSDDIFLESLPYGETREYGRKVLAAAAVYGYLYYQKSPGQIVRELF